MEIMQIVESICVMMKLFESEYLVKIRIDKY